MDLQEFIIFGFFYFLICNAITAQYSISGKVVTEYNESLQGATVVLLDQDSTMMSFGITNADGFFDLQDFKQGKYILQVSYVSYKNKSKLCQIEGDMRQLNLGDIVLHESSEVLQEVTIKAEHIPMAIQGDTITYNTAAFKTKPGATVEDLLKKLPGIEVHRDGSIKAQGENVENVLVDGKEFFGSDPKIATQNLEAEVVDKVQVFEKQSELAEFTGIHDGQEKKTLNLKLKEEYQSGGFGKIQIEGGTESRYHSKLNYNRFNTSMQASTIISANNLNKQAFSFNEYISLMGGLNAALSGNFNDFNFSEFGQSSIQRGITDNYSGGINFNFDIHKKLSLTSNYFYLKSDRETNQTSIGNQLLNRGSYNNIDTSHSENNRHQHRLRTKLVFKQSPITQIEIKNNLGVSGGILSLNNNSLLQSINNFTQTKSIQDSRNSGFDYDGSIQLRNKFGNEGRNWVNSIHYTIGANDEDSVINNSFKSNQIKIRTNQKQYYDSKERNHKFQSKFTEPLGLNHYITIQYSFQNNEETPVKDFFDLENNQLLLNQELSSSFVKNLVFHNLGLSLKRIRNKSKLKSAVHYQSTQVYGDSNNGNEPINNTYKYILPSLYFDWDISSSKSLNASYSTSIKAPHLQQLVPIPDNSNPNILIIGNTNLKPFYAHTLKVSLNSFDNFNFRNVFANIQANIIKDRIVNKVNIDNNFLRTITPFNTDHYFSAQSYISFSEPIRALKIKYRISAQSHYSNFDSFLNTAKSNVTESNTNLSLTFENRKKELIDIAAGIKVDYNTKSYAINESFNQTYFNYTIFFDASWQLNKSVLINTTFDMNNYSGEDFSSAQDYILWNATVKKSFHDNIFSIYLSVFDILGQNQGIQRHGGFNSINDTKFNTLSRYLSFGLSYRLGKTQKKGIQL